MVTGRDGIGGILVVLARFWLLSGFQCWTGTILWFLQIQLDCWLIDKNSDANQSGKIFYAFQSKFGKTSCSSTFAVGRAIDTVSWRLSWELRRLSSFTAIRQILGSFGACAEMVNMKNGHFHCLLLGRGSVSMRSLVGSRLGPGRYPGGSFVRPRNSSLQRRSRQAASLSWPSGRCQFQSLYSSRDKRGRLHDGISRSSIRIRFNSVSASGRPRFFNGQSIAPNITYQYPLSSGLFLPEATFFFLKNAIMAWCNSQSSARISEKSELWLDTKTEVL